MLAAGGGFEPPITGSKPVAVTAWLPGCVSLFRANGSAFACHAESGKRTADIRLSLREGFLCACTLAVHVHLCESIPRNNDSSLFNLADGVGFEPTDAFTSAVFKTAALILSATRPLVGMSGFEPKTRRL